MKLFIIVDRQGWGESRYLLQAETAAAAAALACPESLKYEVVELGEPVAPGVLWSHYESPDTPRGE